MASASGTEDELVDLGKRLKLLRALGVELSRCYGKENVTDSLARALRVVFPQACVLSVQLFISPTTLASVRNLLNPGHCTVELLTNDRSIAGEVACQQQVTTARLYDRKTIMTDLEDLNREFGSSLGASSPIAVCCPLLWSLEWESLVARAYNSAGRASAEELLELVRSSSLCDCLGSITLGISYGGAALLDRYQSNLMLLSFAVSPHVVYDGQRLLEDMALAAGVLQYGEEYQYVPGQGWKDLELEPASEDEAEPEEDDIAVSAGGSSSPDERKAQCIAALESCSIHERKHSSRGGHEDHDDADNGEGLNVTQADRPTSAEDRQQETVYGSSSESATSVSKDRRMGDSVTETAFSKGTFGAGSESSDKSVFFKEEVVCTEDLACSTEECAATSDAYLSTEQLAKGGEHTHANVVQSNVVDSSSEQDHPNKQQGLLETCLEMQPAQVLHIALAASEAVDLCRQLEPAETQEESTSSSFVPEARRHAVAVSATCLKDAGKAQQDKANPRTVVPEVGEAALESETNRQVKESEQATSYAQNAIAARKLKKGLMDSASQMHAELFNTATEAAPSDLPHASSSASSRPDTTAGKAREGHIHEDVHKPGEGTEETHQTEDLSLHRQFLLLTQFKNADVERNFWTYSGLLQYQWDKAFLVLNLLIALLQIIPPYHHGLLWWFELTHASLVMLLLCIKMVWVPNRDLLLLVAGGMKLVMWWASSQRHSVTSDYPNLLFVAGAGTLPMLSLAQVRLLYLLPVCALLVVMDVVKVHPVCQLSYHHHLMACKGNMLLCLLGSTLAVIALRSALESRRRNQYILHIRTQHNQPLVTSS